MAPRPKSGYIDGQTTGPGSAWSPQGPLPAEVWVAGRPIADLRISSDGNDVSFLSRVGSRSDLVLVPSVGGLEEALPLVPAPASGGHSWLPDSHGLVYVGMDHGLHLFDFATLTCTPLTPPGQRASAPEVSPDGGEVAYVVDDMKAIGVAPVRHRTQWPHVVSTDADFVTDPVWSPDSSTLAWVEWDVPNMSWDCSRVVVRPRDLSRYPTPVAGGRTATGDVAVQQPQFSPDGTRLAYLSDQSGWMNLWVVDVPSYENARPLVEETYEHGGPLWGPGTRTFAWVDDETIAFERNEAGWGRLLACDVGSGEVRPLSSDGASRVVGGNGKVAVVTTGPVTASTVVVRDLPTDSEVVVARATPLGIEHSAPVPELVSWHADDGAEVHGRLYRSGEGPRPMLVWTHVGPTDQSGATLYHRFAYFVQRGWSVLVTDHRGTTGWGRNHQQALRGRWGEVDVSDTAAGVLAGLERGWCEPGQVVAIGGSAGGFTTLHLLAGHPELFAAGVALYPVCDLIDLTWSTWRLEAHYNDTLIGPLPESHGRYIERSPIAHAHEIHSPLLVLHGSEDPVVSVKQVRALVSGVEKNGNIVDFHVYEGEGHGWRNPANRIDELSRIENFLRKHVLQIGPINQGVKQ